MKIIIDTTKINEAIRNTCGDAILCKGWVSCMECTNIKKGDYEEVKEDI
jgi:hypothetical protein